MNTSEIDSMQIRSGDFTDQQTIDLLRHHFATDQAECPPGSSHALGIGDMQSPEIRFWTIWHGQKLLGCGALKLLTPSHGEIKSMHTCESERGCGVGSAMLRHIIDTARGLGLSRLSLETGTSDYYTAARALYARYGFNECPPFGNYVLDHNSVFMSLAL